MTDFIDELRAKQITAAELLSAPRWAELEGRFSYWLGEAATEANLDPDSLDHEAAREFMKGELERDILVALMGYSTWLATRLYRRHLATGNVLGDREAVPPCEGPDVEHIATTFGLERATLEWTIDAIHSWQGAFELPGVGCVNDGLIIPDTLSLNQWAIHYEWSSGA